MSRLPGFGACSLCLDRENVTADSSQLSFELKIKKNIYESTRVLPLL